VRELETRLTPSLTTLAAFPAPPGEQPLSPLIMDSGGNLYGTAVAGGNSNDGTIFELAKGSATIITLASFNGTNGQYPEGGLIMDSSGNLFGTAAGGGASNVGTVFELAAGTGTITTLASFNGTDGQNPYGGLVMDASGNLYGTTSQGGASATSTFAGDGTVFEVAQGSGTITSLASFNSTDGANPFASLVMDSSGNLYGTTLGGGASNGGVVFELGHGSGTITTLASFTGTNGIGANPLCAVIMDASGNLYGTTQAGGGSSDGTVFELAGGSGAITTLASFNGTNGQQPLGDLSMDGSGNLYGTTHMGGASGDGTVFKLAKSTGKITTLASFNGTNGNGPYAGLIRASGGNLYGTTSLGWGGGAFGTVFELAHGSATITTLAFFDGPEGSQPLSALIVDAGGNLYGTAAHGGAGAYGTVFELAHGTSTITTLASFNGTDGSTPTGNLATDSGGDLYGTTSGGGASNNGTVFELAAGSGSITTLVSFNGTDGANPDGGLIMDGSGNLYGTTSAGGASGDGTVFEVAQGSGTITTLASFNGTDGKLPLAGLIMDSSGNLYGTTAQGGGDGTIFELAKAGGAITTLASFNGTDGATPDGGLIMDSSGNLYGTAVGGGAYKDGVVFELAQGSSTITTLASFNGYDGQYPRAGLLMDGIGNLYGTTSEVGTGAGTVFEVAQGSRRVQTLVSFNGTDGADPEAALIMDSSGNLYGTTLYGGAGAANNGGGSGTVFELPGAAVVADQWTGANSAVDSNWSDGANWSLGAPPAPGQAAVFTNKASVKDFTSTVDAGFTNAIGQLYIDASWGGAITVNSPLTVTGNFSLASGSFGGSGAVTIGGNVSRWTGGQIDVGTGGFTNTGTLTADTTAGDLVLTGAGTLTNKRTIFQTGTGTLLLEQHAKLEDATRATYDIVDNGGIAESGGGALVNAGTLEKSRGTGTATGTSTIATTRFRNTGTVEVVSGTLDISAAVTQVSGATLTAGTWTVVGGPTVHSKLDITSAGRFTTLGSAASVTLSGPNSTFTNLIGLATIEHGGSFSLLGGQSFTTLRGLRNKGGLTLGPGSVLTVNGNLTQTPAGTLTIELGGTNTAPTFGQLVGTTGTVALAATLNVVSTVVPAVGTAFELLDNQGGSAINGAFKGLPDGATFTVSSGGTNMTFQITYAGTDADGSQNVLITRIS
jgi:uncharacterized repeat protein (TIGR03803 family)